MAELKNYDHADQVISPDDFKLSEAHTQERLDTQANIATARIKEVSVDRNSGGGLEDFFDEFEKHTWWNKLNPWSLATQVRDRVFDVVDQSAVDYQNGLNGSSAARLESQLLKYTRDDVLKQIKDIHAGGLHSLQTLETLKKFTVQAREEGNAQRSEMVKRQKEFVQNRGWWSRTGHKLLTWGSFGAYSLVKTEKRQKWYNNFLEKSMKRQFHTIDQNIKRMEQRVGKQIASMQSRIRRTLVAEADPNQKATYKSELMTALQNTGDLSAITLPSWGITDPQEIVNFLEAAQGLDFVKKDFGVIGISRTKEKQQEEMVASAQAQQLIVKTKSNFKFDDLNKVAGFKGLPIDGVEAPGIQDLVHMIENDLNSVGKDVTKEVFTGKNVGKMGLLTDTVKLVLLVKYIEKETSGSMNAKKVFQSSTRQALMAWIADMDKQTGGGAAEHDPKEVIKQLDVLKDPTTGDLKKISNLVTQAQGLNIKAASVDADSVATLKSKMNATLPDIETHYQTFLNKKGDKDFPDEDFKILEAIWNNVLEARKFLLNQIGQWEVEKEAYDAFDKDHDETKGGRLKDYKDEVVKISQNITDANDVLKDPTASDKAKQAAVRSIQIHQQQKMAYTDKINVLRGERKPIFTKTDTVRDLLMRLSNNIGVDYSTKITPKKSLSGGLNLNERIQQKMRAVTFADELDKKFVEQLEQTDQFNELKQISKGTKVTLTYKKTEDAYLKFPDQMAITGVSDGIFVVVATNSEGVLLEHEDKSKKLSMSIYGPAAKGGSVYKNAKVAKTNSDSSTRAPGDPVVSGAWDSAIILNYHIS